MRGLKKRGHPTFVKAVACVGLLLNFTFCLPAMFGYAEGGGLGALGTLGVGFGWTLGATTLGGLGAWALWLLVIAVWLSVTAVCRLLHQAEACCCPLHVTDDPLLMTKCVDVKSLRAGIWATSTGRCILIGSYMLSTPVAGEGALHSQAVPLFSSI